MTPKTLQPNAHLNTNRLFNASANQIISLAHNLTRLPNMFARAPPSPIQHNGVPIPRYSNKTHTYPHCSQF